MKYDARACSFNMDTGCVEVLLFLVDLGGQTIQTFLLSLDFELGDGQMLFGAATLTSFYIGVPGSAHIVEEIVLQDAIRLLQNGLAVLLQNRLFSLVQQGLGCPLLAPTDLHDGLLDCADQSLVLAAFRPEDLLFDHRHIDHMKVVVVDLPTQSFGHGTVDLIGVHDGREDILLTAYDLDSGFVGICVELFGELVAAVIVEIGRVDIKDQLTVVGSIRFQTTSRDRAVGFHLGEQVGITGGGLLEMDVPFSAVGKNVGIPIAVLFTLIVLLGIANSLVRNGEISDACAVDAIVSCQRASLLSGFNGR